MYLLILADYTCIMKQFAPHVVVLSAKACKGKGGTKLNQINYTLLFSDL